MNWRSSTLTEFLEFLGRAIPVNGDGMEDATLTRYRGRRHTSASASHCRKPARSFLRRRVNVHIGIATIAARHPKRVDAMVAVPYGETRAPGRGVTSSEKNGGDLPNCLTLMLRAVSR